MSPKPTRKSGASVEHQMSDLIRRRRDGPAGSMPSAGQQVPAAGESAAEERLADDAAVAADERAAGTRLAADERAAGTRLAADERAAGR